MLPNEAISQMVKSGQPALLMSRWKWAVKNVGSR